MKVIILGAIVTLAASAALASAGTPGTLLNVAQDGTASLGITPATPAQTNAENPERIGQARLMRGAAGESDTATFHIINGPEKSTRFVGRHYKSPLYSSYQRNDVEPFQIWHHHEWGPSKSLYYLAN